MSEVWQAIVRGQKKLLSWAGLALSVVGTLCTVMRADIMDAFGENGIRACAILALAGAFIAAFGKGLADRREDGGGTAAAGLVADRRGAAR